MLLLLPLSAALGWSLSPVQHSISFARPLSRVRRHGPSNDCLLGNRYTAAQTADRCSAEGVASRCRSTPAAPSMTASSNLKGFDEFVRTNPLTDRFAVKDFHHVEFICGDAKSLAAHWCLALGMQPVAHSNLMTGNKHYASHVISSGSVRFVLTAPYSSSASAKASEGTHAPSADGKHAESEWEPSTLPNPSHSADEMHAFFAKHGVSACAVGVHVEDAAVAYEQAVAAGAVSRTSPRSSPDGDCVVSEVLLYGDTVLRFVSGEAVEESSSHFLPGYVASLPRSSARTFGIERIDHLVGNVPKLEQTRQYLETLSGFHEFAEFTADDVGTVDSGLNSVVLASNNENVLLPLNEPTHGSKRKSQILTYLEQHNGPGVQHIALKTDDIFGTIRAIREMHAQGGGLELMDPPRPQYYATLRDRLGHDVLSAEQASACESLGILADADEQGVLLQIFTKPVGDRSTLFFEIIQRVGCTIDPETGAETAQRPGCGGFGKGNFRELFRAIEEYETRAGINIVDEVDQKK
uniref:4-hydroxyphenylpyruvate dioxygenase n=1 Tax=Chrysotila carterae TaxID=13221 RepID=A0A7S4BIP0_CHRCT